MTPPPSDRIDGTLLRLIGVLGLGAVMCYLDATIVNVSIHTLQARFSVPLSSISWVATGYLLAVAVAVPLAGWSVARFGARRMWLVGLVLFLVGSSLAALSWDVGSLIAFRVLQGLGAGLLEPIMLTMLATAAGPSRTARVMGLMTIPMTLGPVLGPIIGGLILQSLSWQWIFLVNVPVGLLAIVLALVAIPADTASPGQAPPLDTLGVALLCPGFAALVYALSQAGTAGFGVPRVIVALVAGSVLLAGYVVHALRAEHPLIDLKLFGGKGFSSSVVTMFLLGGMLFALLFLLPLFYQQVRGHGVLVAGLLVMPLGLGLFEPLKIHEPLLDAAGRREKIARLLEKVDLKPEYVSRYPHEFSGGQRQRIVIARALALNPDFVVFDESVSALDVSVQAQVLNLINDLKREFGFTALFISHDLSVVRYLCDRVMVMQRGRIVETGEAEALYANPGTAYTRALIEAIPGRRQG